RASRTGSILMAAVATAAPTPSPRATAPGPPSSPTADHDAAPSRATAASSYHHLAMMISGCGRRRSGGKNLRTPAAETRLSALGHSAGSAPLPFHAPLVLQRQLVITVRHGRVGGSGMFGPGAVVGVARSTSAGRSARRSRGRGRGWRAGGGSRCCSTGSGRRRRLSGRLWVPLFRRSLVFGGAG